MHQFIVDDLTLPKVLSYDNKACWWFHFTKGHMTIRPYLINAIWEERKKKKKEAFIGHTIKMTIIHLGNKFKINYNNHNLSLVHYKSTKCYQNKNSSKTQGFHYSFIIFSYIIWNSTLCKKIFIEEKKTILELMQHLMQNQ